MAVIAHPPEWLILEGIAYRRSEEHPAEPPWLHVNRAAGLSVHQQLVGAVGTLVRIATRDYDPLQHESPGSLAREALAAMGVDPATYEGQ